MNGYRVLIETNTQEQAEEIAEYILNGMETAAILTPVPVLVIPLEDD